MDPLDYRSISLPLNISDVMELIIAVDIKSFLFPKAQSQTSGLNSDPVTTHVASALSTIRYEINAVSQDTSQAFNRFWHPILFCKLSANGIQGHLHIWLPDFHSQSHHVTLNCILSSSLCKGWSAPKPLRQCFRLIPILNLHQ